MAELPPADHQQALFAVFALWDRGVGAIAQVHLGGNVFIRPASITRNRVIRRSGADTPGDMSPKLSGLYLRHELLVAYLLERRGLSVDELLAGPIDAAALERELLARSDLRP